jgi:hypothetical protein
VDKLPQFKKCWPVLGVNNIPLCLKVNVQFNSELLTPHAKDNIVQFLDLNIFSFSLDL